MVVGHATVYCCCFFGACAQVVMLRRVVLGGQHPDMLNSLNSLGNCLAELNQLPRAQQVRAACV